MDMNRMLKMTGNEFNGMFITFEDDDVEMFNRNNDMVYDRTVDGWMSEEVMKERERELRWEILANASKAREHNKSKAKKSSNERKSAKPAKTTKPAKTANNDPEPAKLRVYKPNWICAVKCEDKPRKAIVFKPDAWVDTDNDAQITTIPPKKNESKTDREEREMLESGYTDAHYRLNFDTDDTDWDAESRVVDWDAGVTIRQRRDSMGEDWVTESDRTIEEFRLDMRTLDMRHRMRGVEPIYPQHPRSVKPLRLA